jgi:hypothetical protein
MSFKRGCRSSCAGRLWLRMYDEKCLVESFVDPFIGKQVLNVEQIPRMLSVQSGNQFPRIEVGKRNDLDFGKAESFLYDGPNSFQLDRMDCTPKNGSDFDLDLGVSLTNKDEGSVLRWRCR